MLIAVISSDLLGEEGVAQNGTSGRCVVAGCSSSLSVAVTNADQKQLGEESVHLSYISRSQIIPGGSPGRNSSRNGSRNHREALLAGLLTGSYSADIHRQPRSTCLGMVPPEVDWALPHQSSSRRFFTDVAIGQSDGGNSSTKVPSSKVTLSKTSKQTLSL